MIVLSYFCYSAVQTVIEHVKNRLLNVPKPPLSQRLAISNEVVSEVENDSSTPTTSDENIIALCSKPVDAVLIERMKGAIKSLEFCVSLTEAKYDEVLKENVELYQVVTQLQHKVEKLEAVLDKFVTDVDSRSTNKRVETFKLELTGTEPPVSSFTVNKIVDSDGLPETIDIAYQGNEDYVLERTMSRSAVKLPVALDERVDHTNDGAIVKIDSVMKEDDVVPARLVSCPEPWPLANLTTVVACCPGTGRVDDELATVTVSHGHALRRDHLDGRYVTVADAFDRRWPHGNTSAKTELRIVLVLRQMLDGSAPRNVSKFLRVPDRPVYVASAAGRCDVATVRTARAAAAAVHAVDLPVFYHRGTGGYARLNVLLEDGTRVMSTTRKRRYHGSVDLTVDVAGLCCGGAGDGRVECRYRQRIAGVITDVDVVIAAGHVTLDGRLPNAT